jgi:hypothetical protein
MPPDLPISGVGRSASRLAAAAGGAALAWWIADLRAFTLPALAAVEASGIAAMLLGSTRRVVRRTQRWPWPRLAVWAAIILCLIGWQLLAYQELPRSEHPTISSLTNEPLDSHPVRAVAFLAWVAVAGALGRR